MPTINGIAVDLKLREFRRLNLNEDYPKLEFIPFDSPEAEPLIRQAMAFALAVCDTFHGL